MKGRVKGLLAPTSPDNGGIPDQANDLMDPDAQRQALQVLILAQRTADDHVATAQQHAGSIRADAKAAADTIGREAQAHADAARQDANKSLADARIKAEQIVRDAQAHAASVRRDSEKVISDARAAASEIVKDAQAHAADLDREAQQRFDDVVGSLDGKRAALQQQIDALQQFDRDYRSRLRTFMQDQLRALGAAEPMSNAEIQAMGPVALDARHPA